uniref:Large ribosomal subunit protein bL25 n=1 Tax=Candidatus Kentrum sp. FW TaxID=2126338 RepID=A0A450T7W6_9GAMM|nr:MAG: LSU ribosomal protein L25P [Candidatus Kentron sp. FW]VFJ68765.1 MAG: LSU ribosomal protein L25P [Candidatus Kentron sp. FW]
MKELELTASIRHEMGTGASRRMRRGNRIPAILYGEKKDVVPLSLDANTLKKQMENESFGSRIITLNVENAKESAVLKEIQRHPSSSRVLHVDFQRVSETSQIQLNIPLHLINEDTCVGKRAGGVINRLLVEVEVSCLPKDLPEAIPIDIANMEIGQTLHLSDLVVPEGVTLTALSHDMDQGVVTISAPYVSAEEEEEETLEGTQETPTEDSAAEDSGD